ncbi:MAG: LacI family DNA-binding transcriptional regulator [Pseudomonadota bacterium]
MDGTETRKSAPTVADVAKLAGVSTATVSRCLNSPGQVVAKTRDKVQKAVAELGYAPNFSAQALASKQTNTVGAVIPTMENAVFARGIQAFQEELGRHGKTLLIASSSYQQDLEESQVRTLVARGADAILLIGYDRDQSLYDFLAAREVPTLVSWSYDAGRAQAAIGFDNEVAMAELARVGLNSGHCHIGAISAPMAANDRARSRVEGIRRAMAEVGLDPGALAVIETPYGIENGEGALRTLLAQAPQTTLVMCGNDVLAIGALRAAKEMGLSVPKDISITGFDDLEIAQLADPSLTTVHVPHREMGRRAAMSLIQMLNKGSAVESLKLPTDIRLRQSLGKAP